MINILFMGIDFILFCGCCVWFLKRHVRAVKLEMEQEHVRSVRLIEHRDDLQNQVDGLHRVMEDQAQVCDDVSCKVMVWKQRFDEQRAREKNSRDAIVAQVYEKYLKQMDFRQRELYQHQVAAAVVRNVRHQAQEKFSVREKNEQYNDACLRLLEQHKRSL
jgi:hypothetical protein